MAPSSPLIKGYLPLRLKFPHSYYTGKISDPDEDDDHDADDGKKTVDTFLYVKPHQGNNSDCGGSNNCTLFVANAPIIPRIETKLLLKSIFGRYGDVARCHVIQNPRRKKADNNLWLSSSMSQLAIPSFLPTNNTNKQLGRFAHVVMKSAKDLKRTMKQLTEIMMEEPVLEEDGTTVTLSGLTLEPIELQTLADETDRQQKQQQKPQGDDDDDSDRDDEDDSAAASSSLTGLAAVAQRYRSSRKPFVFNRAAFANGENVLMQECNTIMQEWEESQETARRAKEAAAAHPDDDGFVMVTHSHSTATAAAVDSDNVGVALETDRNSNKRRKNSQRNRNGKKQKKGLGATQLKDFYRFQTKEQRKKSIQELRERFEQDLAKVKQLKEEKQYRPF
mmetsp:Transcript_763/g.1417  ORF Transcript_763/g.1417 Transcript_763/m.1417 type:complete len:391 (+) Transcript_763:174-1346(+)